MEISHKVLFQFPQEMTPFTPAGRLRMHKNLDSILDTELQYFSANPIPEESIELNDNRLSKWVSQKGKCHVTGQFVGSEFQCHHIVPKSKGGIDSFNNLVVISPEIHILIHASESSTINRVLEICNLNNKQLGK
jgi:RNA-directed DNA polymerase